MGCLSSSERTPPVQNKENTLKILCLGVGGCGKTTFVKQLKIINNVPWKDVELQSFAKAIKSNLIKGTQDSIVAANKLDLKLDPSTEEAVEQVNNFRGTTDLTDEVLKILKTVWNDKSIKSVVENHSELISVTHLGYFFDNVDRLADPQFVPNEEDILRARVRTAGAHSYALWIDKKFFEFFDVGGQKPERSKWEYVLKENAFATIIYFVASDEYDVENEEDTQYTKMQVSLSIYDDLVNNPNIPKSMPVVLFLNRTDLFNSRFSHSDSFKSFQNTFPDYNGHQDPVQGLEHLKELFLSTNQLRRPLTCHLTCAMDRDSLVVVWRTIKKALLKEVFEEIGL